MRPMSKPAARRQGIAFFAVLVMAGLLTGCDLLTTSQTGRHIRDGNEAVVRGEVQRALQSYEKALDGTLLSAEAHYRLGLLYEDQLKNEVGALHHFERYLELAPQGQFSTDVKTYVDRLRLTIVSRLAEGTVLPANEASRLRNENLALRQQINELRQQAGPARAEAAPVRPAATPAAPPASTPPPAMVVAATPVPTPVTAVSAEQEPEVRRAIPVNAGVATTATTDTVPRAEPVVAGGEAAAGGAVRTYKVERGDTLAAIARKFYRNSGQWPKIAEANKATLPDPRKLQPGMILVIPE